jgi:mono/diheme cytochrome c family protein
MKALSYIVMGAVLSVCASAPAAAQDAKAAKGEAVYAAQKCALCHSIDGKGNKKFPLDGVGKTVSADLLRLWLVDPKAAEAKTGKSGKPAMRSFAKLPAEDIEALVAYMHSLK